MQLFNDCRNENIEIEKTTSWSDGLHEASQFIPFLSRPVRRTDSVDDIQQYKDYFLIAQKNQGQDFTWKNYMEILLDTLRNFDTTALISKIPTRSFTDPIKLETSNYTTVIGSETRKRKYLGDFKYTNKSFFDVDTDTESLSSMDDIASKMSVKLPAQGLTISSVKPKTTDFPTVIGSVALKRKYFENYNHKMIPSPDKNKATERVSLTDDVKDVILTPSKYSIKKMCSEIRILAQKTCKSVEKLATPKRCYAFGEIVDTVATHKKGSKEHIEKVMHKKTMTPSMLKASNFNKNQPTCSRTPMRTTSATCVNTLNSHPKKLRFTPYSSYKMTSVIKKEKKSEGRPNKN